MCTHCLFGDRADMHNISAAWHGGRIIMRQVSPEAIGIFELIMELYTSCSGDWSALSNSLGVEPQEMDAFLDYAGTFLSNLGNYYVPMPFPKTLFPTFIPS